MPFSFNKIMFFYGNIYNYFMNNYILSLTYKVFFIYKNNAYGYSMRIIYIYIYIYYCDFYIVFMNLLFFYIFIHCIKIIMISFFFLFC